MKGTSIIISLFFFLTCAAFANTYSKVDEQTLVADPKFKDNYLKTVDKKIFSEISLEHRYDQLRPLQNNQTTSLRSLSLGFELQTQDSFSLVGELLSDQMIKNELNVNVGELYFSYNSLIDKESTLDYRLSIGIMKLNYGLLNRKDAQFAVLPSYYSILYDLPRGLDTGATIELLFYQNFFSSFSAYAGQNLRTTDDRNRELEVAPHHLSVGWRNADGQKKLSLNYFSRKYLNQPLIQGTGIQWNDDKGIFLGALQLKLEAEFWNFSTEMNGLEQRGLSALLAPHFQFKKLFFQPYVASEQWSQSDSEDINEFFVTFKVGYEFTSYLKFIIERTQIRNPDTGIFREESFQARLFSQWSF